MRTNMVSMHSTVIEGTVCAKSILMQTNLMQTKLHANIVTAN